jgi:hypothetical protein
MTSHFHLEPVRRRTGNPQTESLPASDQGAGRGISWGVWPQFGGNPSSSETLRMFWFVQHGRY